MPGIEDKVNFEYEMFVLDMMRTSKENIFSKSEEIENKKKIASLLKKKLRTEKSSEKIRKAMAKENITDAVYRYLLDYRNLYGTVENIVDKWLAENI